MVIKKIQYNSPVILSYALISLLVYFLNYITKGISNQVLFSVYRSSMSDPLFYFRLVGHIFGHIDFNHYF